MKLYPRSFFERLAGDSGDAVRAALAVGDSRRALDAQLAQLERAAKQLQVLGDTLLRERYAQLHARFGQTLATYRRAGFEDAAIHVVYGRPPAP